MGQPLHGLFGARTRVQWEDALDNGIALAAEASRNPLQCFGQQQLRGTRRWILKTRPRMHVMMNGRREKAGKNGQK